MHIQQCIDEGVLDKVSVFPNFGEIDFDRILKNHRVLISLHLNLVEGKCMADHNKIRLIADENGNLKHTFIGLFLLSLFQRKMLEEQLYQEIRAQVLYWKEVLPDTMPFGIDSHQHTHMIPAVMKAMLRVLDDEKIKLSYMRVPNEPLKPYIKTISLYHTYSAANLIKQWLLKFLWLFNKNRVKERQIPVSQFMGILFSGKMDEKRVRKILPEYCRIAEKTGQDIEVLFHPGYTDENDAGLKNRNVVFPEFYLSKHRKTEYDTLMSSKERGMK